MDAVYVLQIGEKYDYQIDMSTIWPGDTIATVTWTFPTGLTGSLQSNTTTTATTWIERTAGGNLVVTAELVSTAGRKELVRWLFTVAAILTPAEAANVLRVEADDIQMLDLLPQIDAYIRNATGRDWSQDNPILADAKAAARLLLVKWHEDPGDLTSGANALGWGLRSMLVQLEAKAMRYFRFEGLSGAGAISLPGVKRGDTVSTLTGLIGVSGDQAASFETVITVDGQIQQSSGSDLSEKWYQAYIVPPEGL